MNNQLNRVAYSLLYFVIYWISKVSLYIFISEIEVVGKENVPKNGPAIIIANHPNDLIDPLSIGITCGRTVNFWAKSTIFKNPVQGWLLRALGVVPVYRKMDAGKDGANVDRMNNEDLQRQAQNLAEAGRVMVVFPEGQSHSLTKMIPLKDGTSWTKLTYFEHYDGKKDIPVIPCGITYINKSRWRTQMVLNYGPAINCDADMLQDFRSEPKQTVKRLTLKMQEELWKLTLNGDDEILRVAHAARRICIGDAPVSVTKYVEFSRRFVTFFGTGRDPKVMQLNKEIQEYQNQLDKYHLKDSAVRRGYSAFKAVVERLLLVFFLLPFSLLGNVIHAPVVYLCRGINHWVELQESRATVKYGVSLVIVPVWYTFLSLFMRLVWGWNFILSLIFFFVLGWIHIRIFEEFANDVKFLKSSVAFVSMSLSPSRKSQLEQMKKSRQQLKEKLQALVKESGLLDESNQFEGGRMRKRIISLTDQYL
eukprot:TRINITY_DN7785_c0_g1_i1.p1 TRINITY_DN7785_c0_g1~~TRINITY_DN7785_c0_g1_i1.p1  ORF type:complete len:478 (-),score=156.24 TRINITY_DN7785_c0_g1_i1:34-1467(-)